MRAAAKIAEVVRGEPDEAANDNRDPDVIGADDVGAILGVNRKTVYEAAGRGQIPCRRVGRRVIFYRPAIMSWLTHAAGPRGAGKE